MPNNTSSNKNTKNKKSSTKGKGKGKDKTTKNDTITTDTVINIETNTDENAKITVLDAEQNVFNGQPEEVTLDRAFNDFYENIQNIKKQLQNLTVEWRELRKHAEKEIKQAKKMTKKKKGTKRAPSGFLKPTQISDQLAKLLGKEKGTLMSRTDVTKEFKKYIDEHDLQDPDNGKFINPNSELTNLLNLKKSDPQLQWFNIQHFLADHYIKESDNQTTENKNISFASQ